MIFLFTLKMLSNFNSTKKQLIIQTLRFKLWINTVKSRLLIWNRCFGPLIIFFLRFIQSTFNDVKFWLFKQLLNANGYGWSLWFRVFKVEKVLLDIWSDNPGKFYGPNKALLDSSYIHYVECKKILLDIGSINTLSFIEQNHFLMVFAFGLVT